MSSEVDGYYVGAVFHYVVSYSGAQDVDELRVLLPDWVELVAVRDAGGQEIYAHGDLLSCSESGGVYTCSSYRSSGTYTIRVDDDGGRQRITFLSGILQPVWAAFRIQVRLRAPCPGTLPDRVVVSAYAFSLPRGTPQTDEDLAAECQSTIAAIESVPTASPFVLRRANPAQTVSLSFRGQTTTGRNAIINELEYACAVDGQGFGDCASVPFADIFALDSISTFPAAAALTAANNQPNPPAGVLTGTLRVTIPRAAVTQDFEIQVDPMDVQTLSISATVDTVGTGETVTIAVDEARNVDLGYEHHSIERWTVSETSSPLGAAHFQSGLVAVDEATATFAVPAPSDAMFGGEDSVSVTIRAQPRFRVDDTVFAEVALTITRGQPGPVVQCRLTPTEATVGPGGRVDLTFELQHEDDAAWVAPDEQQASVLWRVVSGQGTVASTGPGTAVFTAPGAATTAVVQASYGSCDAGTAFTAAIDVVDVVRVSLDAEPRSIEPGQVTRLRTTFEVVDNTQTIDNLRFRVALEGAVVPIRNAPASTDVLTVSAASPDAAAPLVFGVAFDPQSGEHAFHLPLLAQHLATGREAQVHVQVFYGDDGPADTAVAIASARLTIDIERDPTLREATLFGRVFDDRNGNGEIDPDEPGIKGAMVALAAGVYALADNNGLFHIARLEQGRHVVKLNLSTLPVGAQPVTPVRREMTLTAGMFTKVSFAVRLPRLTEGTSCALRRRFSGLAWVGGGVAYRAAFSCSEGHTLSAHRGGEHVVAERGDVTERLSVLSLPIRETPHWLLQERAADGRVWLSVFGVHVYDHEHGSRMVIAPSPYEVTRLALPRGYNNAASHVSDTSPLLGVIARGAHVAVYGAADSDSAQPCVAQHEQTAQGTSRVVAPAAFWLAVQCPVALRETVKSVAVVVRAPPGPHGDAPTELTATLDARLTPETHFAVGRASVSWHQAPRESTEGAVPPSLNGSGRFFYRGTRSDGLMLTAGADLDVAHLFFDDASARRSAGGLFSSLFAHDPRRVFRDLDPESYYPTYGDASVTVDERESGGRFFFRVEDRESGSMLKWGGINTALHRAEYGHFVRSLYGFGARLQQGDNEDPRAFSVQAFVAQPESAAARDVLLATGTALYRLSHRHVVEGSLRVTLEVADAISGVTLRTLPLTEGSDYEADYEAGRIVVSGPLQSRAYDGTLTSGGVGGHRVRLLVTYEYLPSADIERDWSLGGGLTGRLGPATLSVTAVSELAGAVSDAGAMDPRYQLLGAAARVNLNSWLRLRLELAQSKGTSHAAAISNDGGSRFIVMPTEQEDSGNAASLSLSSTVLGLQTTAYGRSVGSGFTDSRTAPGTGLQQAGLRIDLPVCEGTLWVQADHRRRDKRALQDRSDHSGVLIEKRRLFLLGAQYPVGPLGLALEGRYEAADAVDAVDIDAAERTVVGASARYAVTRRLAATLRRRQVVAGAPSRGALKQSRGDSSLGVAYLGVSPWLLGAEVGASDAFSPFASVSLGAPVDEQTRLYASYLQGSRLVDPSMMLADPEQSQSGAFVFGGRRTLHDGTTLFTEERLQIDGTSRRRTRGAGVQTHPRDGLAVSLCYERGLTESLLLDRAGTRRDAGSIQARYSGHDLEASLLLDARYDERDGDDGLHTGAQSRVSLRATDDVTVAFAVRGANSYGVSTVTRLSSEEQTWEGSLGLAVRSRRWDWLSGFARYALTRERAHEGDHREDWLSQTSHVAAVMLVMDASSLFAISPKLAYRLTQVTLAEHGVYDDALLSTLRADVHVSDVWDASVEGRACLSPRGDGSVHYGSLVEASALVLHWLRFGAGYNFSSVSATGVACNEPEALGAFVRAEALY